MREQWTEAFKAKVKENLASSYARGMSLPELAKAFNLTVKEVQEFLDLRRVERVEQKRGVDLDEARSEFADKIDEDIATCYAKVADLEQKFREGRERGGAGLSPGELAAFAALMNAIRQSRELQAKVLSYMVPKPIAKVEEEAPRELTTSRTEALEQLIQLVDQQKKLAAPPAQYLEAYGNEQAETDQISA